VSRGKSRRGIGILEHRGFRSPETRDLSSLETPRRSPSRGSQGGHASEDPRGVGVRHFGNPGDKEIVTSGITIRDVRKGDEEIVTWKSQPSRASGIGVL
jgi:hypothetical protein